ncbi:MAG: amidase domain-containing protein [Solirubrobacterales bacterium]
MENIKSVPRTSGYSRNDAVEYAKRYALFPNRQYIYFGVQEKIGGDCTNFVSQCLHAGGIPLSYSLKNPWWYNAENYKICSLSWSVAHSLYWYLLRNNQKKLKGAKGYETNNISELELGDLIFYENKNGLIFHSAIITGFESVPLISQHSVDALNVSYIKPYYVAKTHFVKVYL